VKPGLRLFGESASPASVAKSDAHSVQFEKMIQTVMNPAVRTFGFRADGARGGMTTA
jgi:hypothetical protein